MKEARGKQELWEEVYLGSYTMDSRRISEHDIKTAKRKLRVSKQTTYELKDDHPRVNCVFLNPQGELVLLKGRLWADVLYHKKTLVLNTSSDLARTGNKKLPGESFSLNNKFFYGALNSYLQVLVTQDQLIFIRELSSPRLIETGLKVRVDFGFKRRYGTYVIKALNYLRCDETSIIFISHEGLLMELPISSKLHKETVFVPTELLSHCNIVNFTTTIQHIYVLCNSPCPQLLKINRENRKIVLRKTLEVSGLYPTAIGCSGDAVVICLSEQGELEKLQAPRKSRVLLLSLAFKHLDSSELIHTALVSFGNPTTTATDNLVVRSQERIEIIDSVWQMSAAINYTRPDERTSQTNYLLSAESLAQDQSQILPDKPPENPDKQTLEVKALFELPISQIFPLRKVSPFSSRFALFVLRGPEASFYLYAVIKTKKITLVDAISDGTTLDLNFAFPLKTDLGVVLVSAKGQVKKYLLDYKLEY
jgi:hypothetical protein